MRSVVHRLVGYDKVTESIAAEHDIAPCHVADAAKIAMVHPDDVDMIGLYDLSVDQVGAIAGLIGVTVDPTRYDWFFEPVAAE